VKIAAALALLGICCAVQAGCGSTAIQVGPHKAINEDLMESIKTAGSDPTDWIVYNNCNNMGICKATARPRIGPSIVLGTNIYVVKDSRALLTHSDTITMAADRAVKRKCFERFKTAAPLARCIKRGA
jgi:hypothetical protein